MGDVSRFALSAIDAHTLWANRPRARNALLRHRQFTYSNRAAPSGSTLRRTGANICRRRLPWRRWSARLK